MSYPKLERLLALLGRNIESGKIKWEESFEDDSFDASFSDYTVRIQYRSQASTLRSYSLSILNSSGDVVEEVYPEDFADGRESAITMQELFESARRQTRGVEQALDAILRELDDSQDDGLDEDIPF